MTSTAIVNKVRNFCHTLRDDGVGCSIGGELVPVPTRYTLHSWLRIRSIIRKVEFISA